MEDIPMNWHLHKEFSSLILKNLFSEKVASDVTLVAEDNKSVDAHRFVLKYASSFFRDIFVRNPERHLTLHLQGLKYETLVNLVKYIYIGEALVRSEVWQDFMAHAKKWQLVKLINTQENNKEQTLDSNNAKRIKREGIEEQLLSEKSREINEPDDGLINVKQEDHSPECTEDVEMTVEENIKPCIVAASQMEIAESDVPMPMKKKKIRFECDLCKQDFGAIIDLMNHKKEHDVKGNTATNEVGKGNEDSKKSSWNSYHHACDQCDYTCTRPIRLKQHKKSRHGLIE